MEWTSSMSQTVVVLIGFLFVNDMDLTVMGQKADSPLEEVVEMMQENVSIWHKSLCHTGGTLHPDKCSWCLLMCEWKPSGDWICSSADSLPGDLFIPNLEGVNE